MGIDKAFQHEIAACPNVKDCASISAFVGRQGYIKHISQHIMCFGSDSNQVPTEYMNLAFNTVT
jgi:hypothetical protein